MKNSLARTAAFGIAAASLLGCGVSSEPAAQARGDTGSSPVADNSGSANKYPPTTETTQHDPSKVLNFIIIGDAGTQDGVQSALGRTIADLCKQKAAADNAGCHFAIAAGDNIYFFGATSPTDAQFKSAFEDIYAPINIPFYLVLGNHDNGFTGQSPNIGDNQVEYHYRNDRPSNNWRMPARYYSHRWGTVLELFAVDTDTLDGDSDSVGIDASYDTAFQRRWLAEAVKLSPARWKVSFGHYNYISNGNYGDGSATFKAALEEALCDRVQFHIQGHEHDLRWLKPVESCGRTEFIVSGAGGRKEDRPATNLGFEERKGANGISDYRGSSAFMWASILGDEIIVEWYGDNADGRSPQIPVETFRLTRQELGFGN
jgi:hypothetical protein